MLVFVYQAYAQVLYVREGAAGKGTSWQDASGNLASLLLQAQPGTQVWVAKGVYYPTSDSDRTQSFEIPAGVSLFGGFAGNENSLSQRNINLHKTILSGEIGAPGASDNSYNVAFVRGTKSEIDGFIITAGNANGNVAEGERHRSGGGIYIDGSAGNCSPVVKNCSFIQNYAREGAAVYNFSGKGNMDVKFENCSFIKNEAGLDGGAIYNDGKNGGTCTIKFTECLFEMNFGTYGGAICNASDGGSCNLSIQNCDFQKNAAYLRGGALFSLNGDERVNLDIINCNFKENYPDDKNMIFVTAAGKANAYKTSSMTP